MEAREAEPAAAAGQVSRKNDLVCGGSAILLWWLPTCALFVGLSWREVRPWLWIPAFLVMGVACLVNAARCGRLHCFVTGPAYLLAALYAALAAADLAPMRPGTFLLVMLGITILAFLAERSLGTYRKRA
jgi:hypothetical protein